MRRRGDWLSGDWFVTASGQRFHALDPQPEAICIEDIAHALSMICRFGGHTRFFYSVAQHSAIVSTIVRPELALHGLLHDAAEAYCGDVIRPIKKLIDGYDEIETGIAEAIRVRFGMRPLSSSEHDEIKHADNVALVTERRDLIAPHAFRWREDERGYEPLPDTIVPMPPWCAKVNFADRFVRLTEHEVPAR